MGIRARAAAAKAVEAPHSEASRTIAATYTGTRGAAAKAVKEKRRSHTHAVQHHGASKVHKYNGNVRRDYTKTQGRSREREEDEQGINSHAEDRREKLQSHGALYEWSTTHRVSTQRRFTRETPLQNARRRQEVEKG